MADSFSHVLPKNQAKSLVVLFQQAQDAKVKADTYFQGVVDGIPVPEGVDFSFRLSEDATTVLCVPQTAPAGAE